MEVGIVAWDKNTHRAITTARLRLSPPEVVYAALESYGESLSSQRFAWDADKDLELALEARGDALINLGLAQNASNDELVLRLYARALEGSGDLQYDRAVRLACLGNRVAPAVLFSWRSARVTEEELRRLAMVGDPEEVKVLMQNPAAGGVLRDAYSKSGPFNDIPDERLLCLVEASVGNSRLNVDDSDEDGPDMLAWDIHKAIFGMLKTAPATQDWLRVLNYLLIRLSKDAVKTPDEGELAHILQRWASVKVPKTYQQEDSEEDAGWYTDLTFAAEFRCLVAALYGRTLGKGSFEVQGSPGDEDVAKRCAYYGNAKLTPESIRKGFEKDGNAFCFAALLNDELLLDRKLRPEIEPLLRGELLGLYKGRCSQLAKKWRWFDPKPVSQQLEEALVLSRGDGEEPRQSDTEVLAKLARDVADLKSQSQVGVVAQLKSLMKLTVWGLVAIAALILFRN